jgi:membrane protein
MSDDARTTKSKAFVTIARDAAIRWSDDACYRLGASLAYYALFSVFPLLLLCVTAFGFVLGDSATVRGRILTSIASGTSPEIRALLDQTLQSMQEHRTARGVGVAIGAITLFMGASGVFTELESSLNTIWRVKPKTETAVLSYVWTALKDKAWAFCVVIAAATALFLSAILSATLQVLSPDVVGLRDLWRLVEVAAGSGLLAVLLAAVYRVVPQTPVAWRDVGGAAVLTSLLFTALRGLLSWYLSQVSNYSTYGAVGGVLGLLTWIYVVALIFFYGAELSRVYAERAGSLARSDAPPA